MIFTCASISSFSLMSALSSSYLCHHPHASYVRPQELSLSLSLRRPETTLYVTAIALGLGCAIEVTYKSSPLFHCVFLCMTEGLLHLQIEVVVQGAVSHWIKLMAAQNNVLLRERSSASFKSPSQKMLCLGYRIAAATDSLMQVVA